MKILIVLLLLSTNCFGAQYWEADFYTTKQEENIYSPRVPDGFIYNEYSSLYVDEESARSGAMLIINRECLMMYSSEDLYTTFCEDTESRAFEAEAFYKGKSIYKRKGVIDI